MESHHKSSSIGLLGGLCWRSTAVYYENLNLSVNRALGGTSSANIIINSIDAQIVLHYLQNQEFLSLKNLLVEELKKIELAEVDCIGISCNSVHICYHELQSEIKTPIIHIASPLINYIEKNHSRKIGLLGTSFSLNNKLHEKVVGKANVEFYYPSKNTLSRVDNTIINICRGESIGNKMLLVIENAIHELLSFGCEVLVLGCTELSLIPLKTSYFGVPVFDLAAAHANLLAGYAIGEKNTITRPHKIAVTT